VRTAASVAITVLSVLLAYPVWAFGALPRPSPTHGQGGFLSHSFRVSGAAVFRGAGFFFVVLSPSAESCSKLMVESRDVKNRALTFIQLAPNGALPAIGQQPSAQVEFPDGEVFASSVARAHVSVFLTTRAAGKTWVGTAKVSAITPNGGRYRLDAAFSARWCSKRLKAR
jgi:hypothetical protein